MGWFKKQPDPISERSRALTEQIAALESQIKRLDSQLHQDSVQPRLRSTALPNSGLATLESRPTPPVPPEPIFEPVDQKRLKTQAEPQVTPQHYNELGVRKYDLMAMLRRAKANFSGPSTANPKLVNYLAAGSIQGLRPLRYEKRVARNRFILFAGFLFAILLGALIVFVKNR